MSSKANKWIIGSFLILGTVLAGYITADSIRELYFEKTTWMYRGGFFYKLPFILVGLDFIYLTITGLISCISFLRQGHIWKPLTNIILVNIATFFIWGCVTVCDFKYDQVLSLICISITSIVLWLLWKMHKVVKETSFVNNRHEITIE